MSLQQSDSTKKAIRNIQNDGHKINPKKTMRAWHVPATSELPVPADGNRRPPDMWMEEGNKLAGFKHCQTAEKKKGFAGIGIPAHEQREKVPVLAEAMTTAGRHVTYQGLHHDTPRPVMSAYVDGRVQTAAMTVGNNGFVVGMNPVSSRVEVRKGDPGEVSGRTMKNLYAYPLNCPDRRETDLLKQSERVAIVAKATTY